MSRFVKKPVEIEAHQWDGNEGSATPIISWVLQGGGNARFRCDDPKTCQNRDHYIVIDTLEGPMSAMPGDWIIRGVKGEFYPCKPDIFEATYDAVGDDALSILPPVDPEVLDRAVEEGRESVRTGMHVNTTQGYQEQEFRAIAAAAYRQGREDGRKELEARIDEYANEVMGRTYMDIGVALPIIRRITNELRSLLTDKEGEQ